MVTDLKYRLKKDHLLKMPANFTIKNIHFCNSIFSPLMHFFIFVERIVKLLVEQEVELLVELLVEYLVELLIKLSG